MVLHLRPSLTSLVMSYKGPEVYDDPDFFDRYQAKRKRPGNPNDTLEKPVIRELLGEVAGKKVLDLGCGDGAFGRELLDAGIDHYYGVDGSDRMISEARQMLRNESRAQLELADLANWNFPNTRFDIILSRLVLHYIESPEALFSKIRRHLQEGGRFIFSVEHPIITSCYESYHGAKAKRGNWLVDNYFDEGRRENIWIGKRVIKYHKTVETYFRLCLEAGFTVETIRESMPRREHFPDADEFARRKRIPLFLFFKIADS